MDTYGTEAAIVDPGPSGELDRGHSLVPRKCKPNLKSVAQSKKVDPRKVGLVIFHVNRQAEWFQELRLYSDSWAGHFSSVVLVSYMR
jgi:hypothetical protein